MASMVASGNRDGPSVVLKGVDPETCMIVFKNHWAQVVKILEKHDPLRNTSLSVLNLASSSSPRFGTIPGDEASAVQNYVEHMLFLLIEEDCGQPGAMGPILEFVIMENVMERLFVWSLRREFTDDMKLEQLKMYEMLVVQARQPLLHHKPILRPLMMLLSSCSGTAAPQVEAELVLLLNQLCCVLAKDPSVLELFFHTSEDQGATNFLIFSLLIPYIHREGTVGQQARDALLLIMSLSAENQRVAKHIAENTFFCPVAHTDIRDQLISYIYNGFLVPVLAPALHKMTLEEVMTTTAYLELFLRSVSEPALLQTFSLSLALFRTLIGLYCEDVMLQLVLRYLIPCNHMMLSQRRVVRERDCYSVSAAKILALTPSCCSPDRSPPPLRQLESILFSKGSETTDKTEAFSDDDDGVGNWCTIGSELYLDVSYLHYLYDARLSISDCLRACQVWSPLTTAKTHLRTTHVLELEWDDSYDACPVQSPGAISEVKAVEPPQDVQEMQQNPLVIVKDSYIEESDFQDDVMVYNLVAVKDSQDSERTKQKLPKTEVPEVKKVTGGDAKMDCNSNHKNSTSEMAEDLLAQYEELIRTLDPEVGGKGERERKVSAVERRKRRMEMRKRWILFICPFISVLLSRLENMLSNSLHVNLLLTGILAQLAAYPQPLLRSFLLNTNLVFQPSVRSLYQVLAIVKNQIEQQTVTKKDFTEMITTAQHWLLARENTFRATEKSRNGGSSSTPGEPAPLLQNSPPPKPKAISLDRTDVFATVLFSEFLKELAAIAQEHSILSYIPMEE
ncbi:hypothetical protein WMY93_005865 [Mugilogobius chulae]|uniref:FHF complex subunit HOOK-interacting protein C-terminal domain-containing protein n=1 Tax=Mugilogobius chulae TaxID=88201 RepID=A0AAW0PJ26_9GOBI